MPITRFGVGALASLATGATTIKAYCSTGATMVVGQSTAAHSAASCYLTTPCTLGLSTMTSATLGSIVTGTTAGTAITFVATFTACQANSCWGEWGIYNATASGTDGYLLNRLPDFIGVKTCAQSWALTAVVTLST
jgi:hypothetical protein